MCGSVFVKTTIPDMVRRFEFAHPGEVERLGNSFPLWNGAPSLTYPIIIREELPDPRDLMKPFPSELMKMWPIDSKVSSPRNNTADIIDEIGRGPRDLFDV